MVQTGGPPPHEVYCNACRVTFPIGAKRCVHCGGRLARHRFQDGVELPPNLDEVVIDDELPRRSTLSPYTLVWVALLLAGYLWRACTSA